MTQIVQRPDSGGDTWVAQGGSAEIADMTDGRERKIDKDTKEITLNHGEITDLDMPGDKVKFRAERADGAIVVTEIRVVP